MIQANELRIGNWVNHNPSGVNFKIISYHFNELFSDPNKPLIKPIPLTEKWLLRFGFFKSSLDYFKKKGIIVKKEDDGRFECFLGSSIPRLLHVHQLQNLYFALTGEELTLQT